jgi:hypothetical protein
MSTESCNISHQSTMACTGISREKYKTQNKKFQAETQLFYGRLPLPQIWCSWHIQVVYNPTKTSVQFCSLACAFIHRWTWSYHSWPHIFITFNCCFKLFYCSVPKKPGVLIQSAKISKEITLQEVIQQQICDAYYVHPNMQYSHGCH